MLGWLRKLLEPNTYAFQAHQWIIIIITIIPHSRDSDKTLLTLVLKTLILNNLWTLDRAQASEINLSYLKKKISKKLKI